MKELRKLVLVIIAGIMGVWPVSAQTKAEADSAYAAGKYEEAISGYSALLKEGENAEIYYNLGNSFYKTDRIAPAILNYERALLLNPGDAMTRYNLQMAQQAIVDKIEVLPELFLVRWYKSLATSLSADGWAYWSVGFFIVFLIMAALFFYSRSVFVKKTGFVVGIIVFFFTLGAVFFASRQNKRISEREYAIITTPSVTVKGAPNDSGTNLFLIHEGLKVRIVEELGDWYNIRLADGNEGWVAKSDLERI